MARKLRGRVAARRVCAEPFAELSERLLAAGESYLKIERTCFGVAYVISLLEAYGLVNGATFRSDTEVCTPPSPPPFKLLSAPACPPPPAHVAFAESFGPFEASWALGALVSRLMSTTV